MTELKLPAYLDAEVYADWIEYRLKDVGRKHWTDRMARAFLRECERLHNEGYDVPRCLDKAMNAGWLMPYGKDDCKRKQKHRETMVTDLRLVTSSDKETAATQMAALKARARQ